MEDTELLNVQVQSRETILLVVRLLALSTVILLFVFIRALWKYLHANIKPLNVALLGLLLSGCIYVLFFRAALVVESHLNLVQEEPLPEVSPRALELHQSLFVGDMHSDTLLWSRRDFLQRSEIGHVDVPRLLEGNVALQAFTIVTSAPSQMNFDRNAAPTLLKDSLTSKALIEGWPLAALTSLTERALFQALRFAVGAKDSQGRLEHILWREQLAEYVESDQTARMAENGIRQRTAGFLGVEGAHALDGQLSNVDVLFDAGVRMMGLTHFFDNRLGGSAHGVDQGGITELGVSVLERMEALGMLVDVAHASDALIEDILRLSTKPVVSSHSGARGLCPSPRNLPDEYIQGIADTGGLISVGFFRPTICGSVSDIEAIGELIHYICDLVGCQYVALGSDYDGTVKVPFAVDKMVQLTNELLRREFSEQDIRGIMGENMKNLLLRTLPPRPLH